MTPWQETGALRDFNPAYDSLGSEADLTPSLGPVSFASESGHRSASLACPVSADIGGAGRADICVVNDPVGQGFVASMARPGGNITGFTFVDFPLIGKWLEMLKEITPDVRRTTLIFNPQTAPYYPAFLSELGVAASSLAAEVTATPVRDEAEIEAAVTTFARQPGGGLIVPPEPFINTHRGVMMALAQRHRLPAIYGFRQYVTEGALISYGPDTIDIYRRSASYVDRILKGEKPADLPVQAPTNFALAINLRTAKALGLTVPATLLARADEVIE
jgi:putative tryptophan/tyrosine transport system substrate-binding protein